MKSSMKKLGILLTIVFIMTGCKNPLQRIEYEELTEKIKAKESFVLLVSQVGCSHCEEYNPRIKKILNEHDITAYELNITYVSNEDKKKFNEEFEFEGTPTTYFFKDGKEVKDSRLIGNVNDKKIKKALTDEGYIK